MNEVVINLLKESPIVIPKILFKYYKKLNITEEELLILIILINKGEKVVYNPNLFTEELDMDKYTAMQLLNDLAEKKIIEIKLETNKQGKKEEYISIEQLYNKLYANILGNTEVEEENTINEDIYLKFETELGRTISPYEIELINKWLSNGTSEEIIEEALKEAVYSNVRNFKYIDRIIDNWQAKGIKTKKDVIKDKKNYRTKQTRTEPIYDYNWLEED